MASNNTVTTIKVTLRARQYLRITAAMMGMNMQEAAESIFAEKLKSLEAQKKLPVMLVVDDNANRIDI